MVVLQIVVILVCSWEEVSSGSFYSAILAAQSCTSFVKFIANYFILSGAIVNWMVFLISFSYCWLIVYRNTVGFCILIMFHTILLNSLISSNRFFLWIPWVILYLIYPIMSSANRDSFTCCFPMCISFTSFPCLIVLARAFTAMWNWSSKSRHCYLVSNHRGKAFCLSLWSMIFLKMFLQMPFIMRKTPFIANLLGVFKNVFCQMLFLYLLRWSFGFCLSFYYCGILRWLIFVSWINPVFLA